MTDTILIRGGRVIDSANGIDAELDVLVRGDVIAEVGQSLSAGTAVVVDAKGCIVSPGFIDLHTHLREPGFEHKGTIASETLAALNGGFTTVCAMPNTLPAPDNRGTVEALMDIVARDANVRVFPIGCVTHARSGDTLAELTELAAAGCVAFSDDGDPVSNPALMRNALELSRALGLPISEHSDDPLLNGGGVMHEGRVSERLGLAGQPAAAEITAVARNIALCDATGARMHIAHVSTRRALESIAVAKSRGLPVTCEVTPSHLFLTEEAVFGDGPEPAYDTNAKIHPPLRSEDDRRAMVDGVSDGTIDAIATDHAPHAVQDKLCEFDIASPGISCAETALSTVLTLVDGGELELLPALRAMTSGPAAAFALTERVPDIGTLSVGAPADIVVFDPKASRTIDVATFASKGKNTPLAGREMVGTVEAVVAQGRLSLMKETVHG